MSGLFDAHTHLHDKAFDSDRDAVIARMKEEGVRAITVGTDLATSREAIALAELHEVLWASIGLHPNDNREESFEESAYENLVRSPKVVAIGECGLDYFRSPNDTDKRRQRDSFERQIMFAVGHGKPLMIHCREAHEDALTMLTDAQRIHGEKVRGVIHFFTASADIAKRYLSLGFVLSFPGVITFTPMYDEAVRLAPLGDILSETDAPYAAPVPHRGKRNEPLYVGFTVKRLAELKGVSEEAMKESVTHTAERVFGLKSFVAEP
jgi:TatD DNase family protein